MTSVFRAGFVRHIRTAEETARGCELAFERLVGLAIGALKSGGKLMIFGNGGSAADAQHIAAELVVRFRADRRALAAIALTTDTSVLTAAGNDLGYERVFARQIEALAKPGDLALGISTSGNSANVIAGLEAASEMGCRVAGFTGRQGGKMRRLVWPLVIVPSDDTACIQEMHITLAHLLCEAIEEGLTPHA